MAGLTKEQKAAQAAEGAAKAIEAKAIELSELDAEGFAALSDEARAKLIEQANTTEPAKPAPRAKADDSHLVAMTKGGDTIKAHPSCVADHKRLGWVEA